MAEKGKIRTIYIASSIVVILALVTTLVITIISSRGNKYYRQQMKEQQNRIESADRKIDSLTVAYTDAVKEALFYYARADSVLELANDESRDRDSLYEDIGNINDLSFVELDSLFARLRGNRTGR